MLSFRKLCSLGSNVEKVFSLGTATLKEGEVFSTERCFTLDDVQLFSQLCKNSNPIHFPVSSAEGLGFEDCLVPELLYAGLFPAIIGMQFPGAVYVSQKLEFKKPVLIGERLLADVKVINIRLHRQKYRVTFQTACWLKRIMAQVIDGTAIALL
eukprot:c29358_g1_i2 orf=440-901(+)